MKEFIEPWRCNNMVFTFDLCTTPGDDILHLKNVELIYQITYTNNVISKISPKLFVFTSMRT